MKFSEIGQRINGIGISTPIFGVSLNWIPAESAKNIAREVIIYLENRRVLYNPAEMEYQEQCAQSVLEMRRFLTEKITASSSDDLEGHLRAMRGACIKFLQNPPTQRLVVLVGGDILQLFAQALGELRATFGLHIGILAAKYGIDIDENLATILPLAENRE